MIIVARKADGKILSRYEAWARGAYDNAIEDLTGNGYKYLSEEITFMGDMIIWVE